MDKNILDLTILDRYSLTDIRNFAGDLQSGPIYDLLQEELYKRRAAHYRARLSPEDLQSHLNHQRRLSEAKNIVKRNPD